MFGIKKKKQAVVILGYESSGSTFIKMVVSYVLGKSKTLVDSGEGLSGEVGRDNFILLHRSIPRKRPKLWHDMA